MEQVATRLSSEQFLAGLLASLALRQWDRISIRGDRFDRASAAAFEELERLRDDYQVRPRFRIVPHPTYGDSTVVRDAVAKLAQWDLLSLDNPEYQDLRLKISATFAPQIFARLGLNENLFNLLADRFVAAYEGAEEETPAGAPAG
jgi:hypothetical protein